MNSFSVEVLAKRRGAEARSCAETREVVRAKARESILVGNNRQLRVQWRFVSIDDGI